MAVLLSVPVADAEIVQLARCKVTLPPDGKLTVLLMLPEPLAVQEFATAGANAGPGAGERCREGSIGDRGAGRCSGQRCSR